MANGKGTEFFYPHATKNDTTFPPTGEVTYVPVIVNAKPIKQTNADRIRSMTDEELADVLNHAQGDGYLVGIGHRKVSAYGNWLDWLKQECE